MSQNKIRVVSVGCGPRATAHMSAMRDSGMIDLVAACDLNSERLAKAKDQFEIPRTYSDMAEMLGKEKADLVDIVTPPTIRVGIVEDAIAAGARAILIEKPIALKPSESRRLVELGREVLIAVSTQYRWMPHWKNRFYPMLAEGVLGEVRTLCIGSTCNILEQGPHAIDVALQAARAAGLPEPQWVLAAATGLEYFGDIPVPADTAAVVGLGDARMFWNQGLSAPPVINETGTYLHHRIEIVGTKGRLLVTLNKGWQLWREGGFESGETGWPKNDGEAQAALFAELAEKITSGRTKEFPTRVEVAAANSDLMFACYASALHRRRIELPYSADDSVIPELAAALKD